MKLNFLFFHSKINKPKELKPIYLEGAYDTPCVVFDAQKNKISITGKSFPADVSMFFHPLMEWVDAYVQNPNPETIVDVQLDYFNTASSKYILDLLYKFEVLTKNGNSVIIRWHFCDDDEDMEFTGDEYAEILKIPFEMIRHESFSNY